MKLLVIFAGIIVTYACMTAVCVGTYWLCEGVVMWFNVLVGG